MIAYKQSKINKNNTAGIRFYLVRNKWGSLTSEDIFIPYTLPLLRGLAGWSTLWGLGVEVEGFSTSNSHIYIHPFFPHPPASRPVPQIVSTRAIIQAVDHVNQTAVQTTVCQTLERLLLSLRRNLPCPLPVQNFICPHSRSRFPCRGNPGALSRPGENSNTPNDAYTRVYPISSTIYWSI